MTDKLIPTTYSVIRPGSTADKDMHTVAMKRFPTFDDLRTIVYPYLGFTNGDRGDMERVSVLYEGEPCDMFVDETGRLKSLPRNDAATKIYQTFWLKKHPTATADQMHIIAGTAVLFHRRVWF